MKIPTTNVLEYIKMNYEYDPETGYVARKAQYCPVTGKLKTKRYELGGEQNKCISIRALKASFAIYRIAWFLYYDEWPNNIIDHIDGDPTNNKMTNLRLATPAQNSYNKKKGIKRVITNEINNFTSQFKGVSRRGNWWIATISKNWKRILIGKFATEIEAAEAYNKKAIELFGEFASINILYKYK